MSTPKIFIETLYENGHITNQTKSNLIKHLNNPTNVDSDICENACKGFLRFNEKKCIIFKEFILGIWNVTRLNVSIKKGTPLVPKIGNDGLKMEFGVNCAKFDEFITLFNRMHVVSLGELCEELFKLLNFNDKEEYYVKATIVNCLLNFGQADTKEFDLWKLQKYGLKGRLKKNKSVAPKQPTFTFFQSSESSKQESTESRSSYDHSTSRDESSEFKAEKPSPWGYDCSVDNWAVSVSETNEIPCVVPSDSETDTPLRSSTQSTKSDFDDLAKMIGSLKTSNKIDDQRKRALDAIGVIQDYLKVENEMPDDIKNSLGEMMRKAISKIQS